MGSGCCVNTVNCLSSNIYCTLETKCHICSPEVIINCFWKGDNIKTLFS